MQWIHSNARSLVKNVDSCEHNTQCLQNLVMMILKINMTFTEALLYRKNL